MNEIRDELINRRDWNNYSDWIVVGEVPIQIGPVAVHFTEIARALLASVC